MLKITSLLAEYKRNPMGMDEKHPRFCYRLEGDSLRQSARRLVVKDAAGDVVWDTGMVESGGTIQIAYHGAPLKPFTRYTWQVQVKDENGVQSSWSDEAWFETGFLGTPWAHSQWISGHEYVMAQYPPQRIAGDFTVERQPVQARLYVAVLGMYEAYINGQPVTDNCLMPGHTQFNHRVMYQAYDVTSLLRNGGNVVSVLLGDGWYKGTIARWWKQGRPTYGEYSMLRAELRLVHDDGSVECIGSGKHWVCDRDNSHDTVVMSDIYMGETYDAMARFDGWLDPDQKHVDIGWQGDYDSCIEHRQVPVKIVWNSGAPVRRVMRMAPKSITRRPSGTCIVDFGQNMTGREHFILKSPTPGTSIVIKHGEMLNADGSLYRANLRSARATTLYTCAGRAVEEYEPHFTFYGFRYLEISGWPGDLTADQLWVEVLSSDLESTGDFTCSEEMLNQLYSNIRWGQRSNFVDVPTDCPQRDERHGWTGDTQVFANVATYNTFAPEFYAKWIADLNLARVNGCYCNIVPDPFAWGEYREDPPATGWGDAGIICPWVMMRKYGDVRTFIDNLPNILYHLDWQTDHAGEDGIARNACFGDWLNLNDSTDEGLLSTSYLVGMNRLVARMARLVGNGALAAERDAIADDLKRKYIRKFFTPDGELTEKSQTAMLLTLHFGLCPDETSRRQLVQSLVENIRGKNHTHLTTGFLGTPLLLGVLTENGQVDLAYDLLLQTSYPGWLYPVTQGATTMWERWNSWTAKDGFGPVAMNSFNHYAYGAVGEWFYETICGINPDGADDPCGFKCFRLQPHFGHRLQNASAKYDSIYGTIVSEWERQDDGTVKWRFAIPCNTTAKVATPDGRSWIAQPGTHEVTVRA